MKHIKFSILFVLITLFVDLIPNDVSIIKAETSYIVQYNLLDRPILNNRIIKDDKLLRQDLKEKAFVVIAEKEVGNVGGMKYINWYDSSNKHKPWCAIFVSWCANEALLLDDIAITKFASVRKGSDWFKQNNKWLSSDNRPQPGMIVFFDFADTNLVDNNLDGIPDHVGIVKEVTNSYVYTIEGNRDDVCSLKKYKIDSPYLNGYGMIK